MRYAIAVHGTRGDIEPAVAIGLELIRRGHDVKVSVPPNLMQYVASLGIPSPVAYGPDSQRQVESEIFSEWQSFNSLRSPGSTLKQLRAYVTEGWSQMNVTLAELAKDADLILTGPTYQPLAANVAEYHNIPLAAFHVWPQRMNTVILPIRIPRRFLRPMWNGGEWAYWQLLKPAEEAQRKILGLKPTSVQPFARMQEQGALEIQAYDEALFPGISKQLGPLRPITGAITLQSGYAENDAVSQWLARNPKTIYFGLGSMPVRDPQKTLEELGQIAGELSVSILACTGGFTHANKEDEPLMVVRSVRFASVFHQCSTIVHHGGAGTTAEVARSGTPSIILWVGADQPLFAQQVKRLKIGTARRFKATTGQTLRRDLQKTLDGRCKDKARQLAEQMTTPEQSLAAAADLLERAATEKRIQVIH